MEKCVKEVDLFEGDEATFLSGHDRFMRLVSDLLTDAKKIATEKGFDGYAVSIRKNETKTETNYPIEFNDIPYPFDETNGKGRMVTSPIAVLAEKSGRSKFADCVEIRLRGRWWTRGVAFPPSAVRKDICQKGKDGGEKGKVGENVYISLADDTAKKFLEDLIRCRLDNYESSFPPFGCCYLYQACSESGECLQKSRSYSGACQYKRNLDSGKVFYGKNRNKGVEE